MHKFDLTAQDHELVKIACAAAKRPVLHINNEKCPALVTSAARLDNGDVVTGSNLMADVGSISMCAEPFAINESNRREGRSIVSIVAVYHQPGFEPKVIPPCGRCREVIVDFMPGGHVILRDPGSEALYKVKPTDLLPLRYGDFWKGDTLT